MELETSEVKRSKAGRSAQRAAELSMLRGLTGQHSSPLQRRYVEQAVLSGSASPETAAQWLWEYTSGMITPQSTSDPTKILGKLVGKYATLGAPIAWAALQLGISSLLE